MKKLWANKRRGRFIVPIADLSALWALPFGSIAYNQFIHPE